MEPDNYYTNYILYIHALKYDNTKHFQLKLGMWKILTTVFVVKVPQVFLIYMLMTQVRSKEKLR